jgi:hypothetical protein
MSVKKEHKERKNYCKQNRLKSQINPPSQSFFLCDPCVLSRLFRLFLSFAPFRGYSISAIGFTLVAHAEHGILHLVDQCAVHGDRNIAEQKQSEMGHVLRLNEPAP